MLILTKQLELALLFLNKVIFVIFLLYLPDKLILKKGG